MSHFAATPAIHFITSHYSDVTMTWKLRLTQVTTMVAAAAATCPSSYWKEYRGACYWVSDYLLHWEDVADVCTTVHPGAQLASVHDVEQNAFLAGEVAGHGNTIRRHAWLGLHRDSGSSSWKWTDGTPYDFSLWFMNDPDKYGGNCVMLNWSQWGMWSAQDCESYPEYFMCTIAAT